MSQAGGWRRAAVLAAVVGAFSLLGVVIASALSATIAAPVSDFQVYWGAVGEVLAGRDPYAVASYAAGEVLPFIYPPFALVVMMPIGLVPMQVARIGWAVIEVAVVLCLVVLVRSQTPAGKRGWRGVDMAGLALAGAVMLATTPMLYTISTGQIGLVLMAMVLVDFTLVPRQWRGVLTGLAAAIKLTPLVFLPYLLLTRQWRAAALAAGSFVGATALGWVLLPADSLRFWTASLYDSTRTGGPASPGNKSLLGLLTHWLPDGSGLRLAWVLLVLVIAAVSLWQARRLFESGGQFEALLTVGLLSTVISPISWWHHLVWLSVAAIYLVYLQRRWPVVLGLLLVVAMLPGSILVSVNDAGNPMLNALSDLIVIALIVLAMVGLPRSVLRDT